MKLRIIASTAAIIVSVGPLYAQDGSQSPASARTIDLGALVQQVAEVEDLEFLLDGRTCSDFVGGTPIENPGYTGLLSILRLDGWSAIEVAGRINIVPTAEIRSQALPLVQRDDPSIPDGRGHARHHRARGESRKWPVSCGGAHSDPASVIAPVGSFRVERRGQNNRCGPLRQCVSNYRARTRTD